MDGPGRRSHRPGPSLFRFIWANFRLLVIALFMGFRPLPTFAFRWLAARVFFLPAYIWAVLQLELARFCAWRAWANYPGGYWLKACLKLRARAYSIVHESLLEEFQFTIPITTKENPMKAIDRNTPERYTCKCDKELPPEERTVFMLLPLDPWTDAKLDDEVYKISGMGTNRQERVRSGTQRNSILTNCLVGWENFPGPDGRPVEFDKNCDPMENIAKIPIKQRREMVEHLRGESEASSGE